MKPTISIAMITLSLTLCQPAQAFNSFFYYRDRLPLNTMAADCRTPRTIQVAFYKNNFRVCVDHTSWIRTAVGGRVQVITASGQVPFYGSFFEEVNCLTMEKRSKNLWGFTKRDMSNAPSYASWKKNGDIWSSHSRTSWDDWEPIKKVSSENKWICQKFRGST